MERPEKQQEGPPPPVLPRAGGKKGPPPPVLPLSGEATDWLASLEIICQFSQDFIDKRLRIGRW